MGVAVVLVHVMQELHGESCAQEHPRGELLQQIWEHALCAPPPSLVENHMLCNRRELGDEVTWRPGS